MKASEVRLHLTEAQFQEMIVARARAQGWLIHHDRGDYRQCIAGDSGFPDLVMSDAALTIFAEVKSERGKLTDHQAHWLQNLSVIPADQWLDGSATSVEREGVLVAVWRPSDWPTIQEVLA